MATSKIWFITGAARGFGRLWATAALERGDKVAATARDVSALDALVQTYGDAILPLKLDVTDRRAVFDAVARAKQVFGRLDVVLSNAGYGHQGAVEEVSEEDARVQIDTNLFGALWVTQAALPILRAQGSGHLIAVSSVLGVVGIPNFGIYNASKFALEGLYESLSQEVAGFGVKVTLIEPAGYATDFNGSSAKQAETIPDYDGIRQALAFYELYTNEEGLVHELPFGNWEDSLLFTGARAFTNLMYLEALRRETSIACESGRAATDDVRAALDAHVAATKATIDALTSRTDSLANGVVGVELQIEAVQEQLDDRKEKRVAFVLVEFPLNFDPIDAYSRQHYYREKAYFYGRNRMDLYQNEWVETSLVMPRGKKFQPNVVLARSNSATGVLGAWWLKFRFYACATLFGMACCYRKKLLDSARKENWVVTKLFAPAPLYGMGGFDGRA